MGIFLVISDAQGALIVHRFLRTTAAPPLEIPEIRKIASDLKVKSYIVTLVSVFGAKIQIFNFAQIPIFQLRHSKARPT